MFGGRLKNSLIHMKGTEREGKREGKRKRKRKREGEREATIIIK